MLPQQVAEVARVMARLPLPCAGVTLTAPAPASANGNDSRSPAFKPPPALQLLRSIYAGALKATVQSTVPLIVTKQPVLKAKGIG